MNRTVCFYFQVHQPWRLKQYRFFNMGADHHYLDDPGNRSIMEKVARLCYLPMNELLLRLIEDTEGKFRLSFSISGTAMEQFEHYAPQVMDSFRRLADTGCVEFLTETYSHSLAALADMEEFKEQVNRHADKIYQHFGQRPQAFRNTELIYSDLIGEVAGELGYNTVLAEGARHILGWKSPNFIYSNALDSNIKLLLRNYRLSDDIAFRFSDRGWKEWPLTADKYIGWLTDPEQEGELINLFMDYETFGEHQNADTGIFRFFESLVEGAASNNELRFATVSEAAQAHDSCGTLSSPHPMSWADEERDVTAWLGNEMQNEAFSKLYALRDMVKKIDDPDFEFVWSFLQGSDHFYYMATKWFSDGDVHSYFNPYDSSYEAFINYMNVLSDFQIELRKRFAQMYPTKVQALCEI